MLPWGGKSPGRPKDWIQPHLLSTYWAPPCSASSASLGRQGGAGRGGPQPGRASPKLWARQLWVHPGHPWVHPTARCLVHLRVLLGGTVMACGSLQHQEATQGSGASLAPLSAGLMQGEHTCECAGGGWPGPGGRSVQGDRCPLGRVLRRARVLAATPMWKVDRTEVYQGQRCYPVATGILGSNPSSALRSCEPQPPVCTTELTVPR